MSDNVIKSYRAGEALSTNYRAVYWDGSDGENVKTLADPTDRRFAGIIQSTAADDATVQVCVQGKCRARLAATAEVGDLLMVTTAGALTKLTTGNLPCAVYLGRLEDGAAYDGASGVDAEVFVLGHAARALPILLTGSKTHDFGTIADEGEASTTITVTGATATDTVVVNAPELDAGLTIHAYVSAADTVTVKVGCFAAAGVDTTELNLTVIVFSTTNAVPA